MEKATKRIFIGIFFIPNGRTELNLCNRLGKALVGKQTFCSPVVSAEIRQGLFGVIETDSLHFKLIAEVSTRVYVWVDVKGIVLY